jgi:hypothetical protein
MSIRRLTWPLVLAAALALTASWSLAGHNGPHGGALFEGVEHKYHAELKLDAKEKKATVWILDGKAKNEVPIPAKTIEMHVKGLNKPIVLNAVPRKGSETATQYTGTHDRLGMKLKYEEVEFLIAVDGKKAHKFTYEE